MWFRAVAAKVTSKCNERRHDPSKQEVRAENHRYFNNNNNRRQQHWYARRNRHPDTPTASTTRILIMQHRWRLHPSAIWRWEQTSAQIAQQPSRRRQICPRHRVKPTHIRHGRIQQMRDRLNQHLSRPETAEKEVYPWQKSARLNLDQRSSPVPHHHLRISRQRRPQYHQSHRSKLCIHKNTTMCPQNAQKSRQHGGEIVKRIRSRTDQT